MYPDTDTDRYGDGDIPEADYKPYQDNDFDPHPQAGGENHTPTQALKGESI